MRRALPRWVAPEKWERIEHFDEAWKQRIREMSKHIAAGESVLDLGCGKMWLREFLPGNAYYPVDYRARDASTRVADFNKHEYPDVSADVAFVSGTLEYVADYDWFIGRICAHSRKCVLSYCTLEDYPDLAFRKEKAWRNHLRRRDVVDAFTAHGMQLRWESEAMNNRIFVFSSQTPEPAPTAPTAPTP